VTPAEIAATLAALVDVLLPGDEDFPAASTVGTQALLAERLRQRLGTEGVHQLATALSGHGAFNALTREQQTATVARLEQEQPDLFALAYTATNYAYYQSPTVVAAIRALGHDYNDAPLPEGYDMPKFDFTPGVDVPLNPIGTYKWTDEIERVDISPLAALNLPVKAN
jgi:predicted pyridoxine 5'-phosphate oxidase superfamily flavin-nucleotide-binding protein